MDWPVTLINTVGNVATIQASVSLTAAAAAQLPAVQSAHVAGDRLHLETMDVPMTLAAHFGNIDALGHRVRELDVKQPDLEDLFLHLTGRSSHIKYDTQVSAPSQGNIMFNNHMNPTACFGVAIFRTLPGDYQSMTVTLLTPMFMLGMFAFMAWDG